MSNELIAPREIADDVADLLGMSAADVRRLADELRSAVPAPRPPQQRAAPAPRPVDRPRPKPRPKPIARARKRAELWIAVQGVPVRELVREYAEEGYTRPAQPTVQDVTRASTFPCPTANCRRMGMSAAAFAHPAQPELRRTFAYCRACSAAVEI